MYSIEFQIAGFLERIAIALEKLSSVPVDIFSAKILNPDDSAECRICGPIEGDTWFRCGRVDCPFLKSNILSD